MEPAELGARQHDEPSARQRDRQRLSENQGQRSGERLGNNNSTGARTSQLDSTFRTLDLDRVARHEEHNARATMDPTAIAV